MTLRSYNIITIKRLGVKGDYQNRVDSLTKLYEGIEGADINKELTADLIGDYLFTDKDFIQRLSTDNRSAFQKIYDEIKYLCRVATAGSKQARELEKIKKTFAEVYRVDAKNPTADGGVRYSFGVTQDDIYAYVDGAYQKTNDEDYKPYAEVSQMRTLRQYMFCSERFKMAQILFLYRWK